MDIDYQKLFELGVTGFIAIFSLIKIYQTVVKINNKLNIILAMLGDKNFKEDDEEEK